MIIKITCVIALLYLVPCVVGYGTNCMLKIEPTLIKNYLVGNVFIWALFQLITVPLVLMKQSFMLVVISINVVTIGLCAWVLINELVIKKRNPLCIFEKKKHRFNVNPSEIVAVMAVLGIVGWLLYQVVSLQHTDADDSRFVVNAVEIVRTNRMFLTDLITGQPLKTWIGELIKDITAPWAVYIAYYAKMTKVAVVTMAHSVLPVSLILCGVSVFWLLAKEFFKERLSDRCVFMCFILLLNLYGHYSVYTAETFFLTRIWQGKSVVAAVAIPAMFLFCMWLYQHPKRYGNYVLIAMLNLGMCLMSGMGIIIGAIMLGCTGLVYGIKKKNWWLTLMMWEMCIPNIIYFFINEMQPEIWGLS